MAFEFEKLQLGSTVKVIDEELGIDVETNVVKIEHPDLLNPQEMTIELATQQRDIADTLAEVYDVQQLNQHIAIKIGAGQVVVLGEFVVSDWVTDGTTNIKGGYIRTGILESTNWGAGAGSQFNLDDGTFKLGGSSSPKLSWNGTTLIITGTLKASNIEAGETLIVNGTISGGGGTVLITNSNMIVIGQKLNFKDTDETLRGWVWGGTSYFEIRSASGSHINIGATNANILLDGDDVIMMADSLRPYFDNAHNLGASTKRWKDFYAVTVHEGDTVFANDWRLTESADNQGIRLLRPDGSVAREWR